MCISPNMQLHFFSPDLQYCGKDCNALANVVGVDMNLVPILTSKKVVGISKLTLSDLSCIMALLSDDVAGQFIEWVQSAGIKLGSNQKFEPR
jgi:hypothetical protein